MALSISCCHNLPPPPSNTSAPQSLDSKISHLGWPHQSRKQKSWPSRCVVGAATVIVALEIIKLPMIGEPEMAFAWDSRREMEVATPGNLKAQRWSDRRTCPPWRDNSLETIVPENLPRPSVRRRWEAVEFPHASPDPRLGPAAKFVTGPKNCFSL